jgi:hypothetical protein
MTLIPAYGRDYKSVKAMKADFDANKDFIVADLSDRYDGKPVNKADLQSIGQSSIMIRYSNLRKISNVQIT